MKCRRCVITCGFAIALLALSPARAFAQSAPAARQPNIVIILAEAHDAQKASAQRLLPAAN